MPLSVITEFSEGNKSVGNSGAFILKKIGTGAPKLVWESALLEQLGQITNHSHRIHVYMVYSPKFTLPTANALPTVG